MRNCERRSGDWRAEKLAGCGCRERTRLERRKFRGFGPAFDSGSALADNAGVRVNAVTDVHRMIVVIGLLRRRTVLVPGAVFLNANHACVAIVRIRRHCFERRRQLREYSYHADEQSEGGLRSAHNRKYGGATRTEQWSGFLSQRE